MSSNPFRILLKSHPQRSIALCTADHVLIFRHTPSAAHTNAPTYSSHLPHNQNSTAHYSDSSLNGGGAAGVQASIAPKCMVEFSSLDGLDLSGYHPMGSALPCRGTLGLISLNGDVFVCVVTGASQVATVRPGETVFRIHAVEFHCLNRPDFDNLSLEDMYNDYDYGNKHGEGVFEHPCAALRKMVSEGTFYYSTDFDLTNRLQDRSVDHTSTSTHFSIDTFNDSFLWNIALIKPLLLFRSRLPNTARLALDSSRILTSAIRGFVETVAVPRGIVRPGATAASYGSTSITIISRLSCKRAGTRFNSRGIDDDGHVANFVETETVVWDGRGARDSHGVGFSYTQVRGSVPVFWEQSAGLLPGQQKIHITRSAEATQPSFDKHMEGMNVKYGPTHIINLLSKFKPGEAELTRAFNVMVTHSPLLMPHEKPSTGHLLKETEFDFHEETKNGYEAASQIRLHIDKSADAFAYFLTEDTDHDNDANTAPKSSVIMQQEGVFRTNCLDCLDRTNLVQQIVSQMAIERYLHHANEKAQGELWLRHQTLWADNGDALSRIYAGTGALKSSFTRTGKMSLSGALADVRKSATRMYINNFADKGRQNTIDMLLGRLVGQEPVVLFDPINDYVNTELAKKASQFSTAKSIRIHVGTFNLNGRMEGIDSDLSPWVFPDPCPAQHPEIVVIGFQEIVELSPQQIMSTDPGRRQEWEQAVLRTLNRILKNSKNADYEYIMLRGGQLVGAALAIYVRSDHINTIKNVEGSLKKTGMSGLSGNKGAVAIRLEYANTRICFVTAHLAAGFANYEERNRDYRTISTGLRFQRGRVIDDHDVVIWLGDFNYRIGLGNEDVRHFLEMGNLEALYENDQLNLQMVAGWTFPYYSEAKLNFMPTYKYDLGTDRYDTSEKARIPAWCDRILRKGSNLRQLSYNCAPLKFSDHRPVYATFEAAVSIINEDLKESLAREIYLNRRDQVGSKSKIAQGENSDDSSDDDLLDYEPIAPGLPPASTDSRKWWLDNGVTAKSQVKPPGDQYDLNPNRPANPFSRDTQPDWVKKGAPAPPPARGSATRSVGENGKQREIEHDDDYRPPQPPRMASVVGTTQAVRNVSERGRKLPPPFDLTALPKIGGISSPPQPARPFEPPATLMQPLQPNIQPPTSRSSAASSMRPPSPTSSINSKSAPPIPKKPINLISEPTSSSRPTTPKPTKYFDAPQHLSSSNTGASTRSMSSTSAAPINKPFAGLALSNMKTTPPPSLPVAPTYSSSTTSANRSLPPTTNTAAGRPILALSNMKPSQSSGSSSSPTTTSPHQSQRRVLAPPPVIGGTRATTPGGWPFTQFSSSRGESHGSDDGPPPPLPPRTNSMDLLAGEEEMGEKWKPLEPARR